MSSFARLHLAPPIAMGSCPPPTRRFSFEALAGRFVEISGDAAAPILTVALMLVADTQRAGENVAWITDQRTMFYAIDALAIDLTALPIIRAPDAPRAGRAASHLLRSGAFGLVVLDLAPFSSSARAAASRPSRQSTADRFADDLPLPLQSRLSGLAQKHGTLFTVLTEKPAASSSLGSLVSLHARVTRGSPSSPDSDGYLRLPVNITMVKDKRHGPGWHDTRTFRAPDGIT